MATTITKSNFTTDKTIDTLWHKDSGEDSGSTHYIYVSCACFDIYYTVTKNWGSWGRSMSMTAYYYSGSSWIKAGSTQSDSPGQFDSGTYSKHFRHNWSGYSQDGDRHNYHLWKIVIDMPELYNKYIYLQCGSYYYGAEDWADKKIYGTGSTYMYEGNNDAEALSRFKTSNRRGNKIYANSSPKSIFFTNDVR